MANGSIDEDGTLIPNDDLRAKLEVQATDSGGEAETVRDRFEELERREFAQKVTDALARSDFETARAFVRLHPVQASGLAADEEFIAAALLSFRLELMVGNDVAILEEVLSGAGVLETLRQREGVKAAALRGMEHQFMKDDPLAALAIARSAGLRLKDARGLIDIAAAEYRREDQPFLAALAEQALSILPE